MADTTKNILLRVKSDTDDAEKGFKSLKQELREIEKELSRMEMAGQDGTKQFQEMAIRAGELKDQIGDTKARINALASDTFKLDAMTGAVEGLASGFAIVEGATALFGSENEDLQKSLVKVQGAMALLQGATALQNLTQKQSPVYIAITTTAQKLYNAVVGESVGVTKAFRVALATTGVGVLVGVIGYLASNWENLTDAIGMSNRQLGIAKETMSGVAEQYADEQVNVAMLVSEFEKANTSAERKKEILNELNEISPNYFSKEIQNINDLKKAQDKFNQSILAQIGYEGVKATMVEKQQQFYKENLQSIQRVDEINREIASLQKEAEKEGGRGKATGRISILQTEKADLEIALNVQKGLLKRSQEDLLKYAEGFKATMDKLGGEAIPGDKSEPSKPKPKTKEKTPEERKKELEKLREYEAEYEESLKKQREKNAKEFDERTQKEYENAIKLSDEYFDHLINQAKINGEDTNALEIQKLENQLQIQNDYAQKTIAIQDEIALKEKAIKDEAEQKEKERKLKQFESTISDETISFQKRLQLNKMFFEQKLIDETTYNENAKKLEKGLFQSRVNSVNEWLQVTQDSFNLLGEIHQLYGDKDDKSQKDAFEKDKKFKIASAITGMLMGVVQQLAVPQDQLSGVNFAKAGLVLATGLVNIEKIKQTKFESKSTPNSGGKMSMSGGSLSNGAIGSQLSNSTKIQLDQFGNMKNPVVRAYVVESEVTGTQQRAKRLKQTSKIN